MRIRQVDNAFDLIELFARQKTPMTLSQLSRALAMPKSSTFNLIDTLLARGLLYEINSRAGYYPTRRMFDLARDMMEGDSFLQLIHGELETLAADTGETVLIASRDPHNRNEIVYIDAVESTAPIRYFAKVGDKRPIYTTSSGKAILSSYPPDERRRILASLTYVKHQTGTVTGEEQLAAVLDAAIARGWCEDSAEFTPWRQPAVKARGDDGDAHLVPEGVVDDRAENDVGFVVCRLGDQVRGLVDLEQTEV
jgi:DNA-binding IclR family transcriptional regulator